MAPLRGFRRLRASIRECEGRRIDTLADIAHRQGSILQGLGLPASPSEWWQALGGG